MITNERQLLIARRELNRFRAALDGGIVDDELDPMIARAQLDAVSAQVRELQRDIDDYLRLREGKIRLFEVSSFADLPDALIKARIAAGMTQAELAGRLSLKEQQIQRYESQRYEGASFSRIADIADAIGVKLSGPLALSAPQSSEAILQRAAITGVDARFIAQRIAPSGEPHDLAERLGYVFDWKPEALLTKAALELPAVAGASARFKMPRGRNAKSVAAYSVYAHRLAEICADAMPSVALGPVPIDAKPMIQLIERKGPVSFATALETAWDLGIIVLPLADSGQFHGACWRFAGTNVVVLKQSDRSAARWLIDLLHEMFHAGRFPEDPDFEVVEEDETSETRRTDPEELQATWFASLVATAGRAEELFKSAITSAGNDLRRLKSAIVREATIAKIDSGVLANYAAHRLSMQGVNWWGAAANVQDRTVDPLELARDTFFRRFDFARVDKLGFELLQLALHDEVNDG